MNESNIFFHSFINLTARCDCVSFATDMCLFTGGRVRGTDHPRTQGLSTPPHNQSINLSIYLSYSLGDRWGTTQPGNQLSPFLLFLCSPHGVAQFQTRPIPDVIFPPFSLSASASPFLYSALEDCLGKFRSSCNMPIPLHFEKFFLQWTRVLRRVQRLSESCFAPLRWWCGLCTRCQGDVWNFSFPLSVSFSLFLLLMSRSHKNIII